MSPDHRAGVAEAARLLAEIEKSRKTVEENEQKVTAATAAIDQINIRAASLDQEVREQAANLEAFKITLDERNRSLDLGNTSLVALVQTLNDKTRNIDDLTKKAEEMLGGATVAGLSSAFDAKVTAINSQLTYARWGFFLSLLLLAISVAAALNMLGLPHPLPVMPIWTATMQTGSLAIQVLASLGSRALVILPSLLLAGFAAHRHSTLFRLREEYSHRYSLAASVQGFKIQAPNYQNEIAANVFQELLENPAKTMDAHSVSTNRTVLERIIFLRARAETRSPGWLNSTCPRILS